MQHLVYTFFSLVIAISLKTDATSDTVMVSVTGCSLSFKPTSFEVSYVEPNETISDGSTTESTEESCNEGFSIVFTSPTQRGAVQISIELAEASDPSSTFHLMVNTSLEVTGKRRLLSTIRGTDIDFTLEVRNFATGNDSGAAIAFSVIFAIITAILLTILILIAAKWCYIRRDLVRRILKPKHDGQQVDLEANRSESVSKKKGGKNVEEEPKIAKAAATAVESSEGPKSVNKIKKLFGIKEKADENVTKETVSKETVMNENVTKTRRFWGRAAAKTTPQASAPVEPPTSAPVEPTPAKEEKSATGESGKPKQAKTSSSTQAVAKSKVTKVEESSLESEEKKKSSRKEDKKRKKQLKKEAKMKKRPELKADDDADAEPKKVKSATLEQAASAIDEANDPGDGSEQQPRSKKEKRAAKKRQRQLKKEAKMKKDRERSRVQEESSPEPIFDDDDVGDAETPAPGPHEDQIVELESADRSSEQPKKKLSRKEAKKLKKEAKKEEKKRKKQLKKKAEKLKKEAKKRKMQLKKEAKKRKKQLKKKAKKKEKANLEDEEIYETMDDDLPAEAQIYDSADFIEPETQSNSEPSSATMSKREKKKKKKEAKKKKKEAKKEAKKVARLRTLRKNAAQALKDPEKQHEGNVYDEIALDTEDEEERIYDTADKVVVADVEPQHAESTEAPAAKTESDMAATLESENKSKGKPNKKAKKKQKKAKQATTSEPEMKSIQELSTPEKAPATTGQKSEKLEATPKIGDISPGASKDTMNSPPHVTQAKRVSKDMTTSPPHVKQAKRVSKDMTGTHVTQKDKRVSKDMTGSSPQVTQAKRVSKDMTSSSPPHVTQAKRVSKDMTSSSPPHVTQAKRVSKDMTLHVAQDKRVSKDMTMSTEAADSHIQDEAEKTSDTPRRESLVGRFQANLQKKMQDWKILPQGSASKSASSLLDSVKDHPEDVDGYVHVDEPFKKSSARPNAASKSAACLLPSEKDNIEDTDGYVRVKEKSTGSPAHPTDSMMANPDEIPMKRNKGYDLMAFEGQNGENISVQQNVGYDLMKFKEDDAPQVSLQRNDGYEAYGFNSKTDNITMEQNLIYDIKKKKKKRSDSAVIENPSNGKAEEDFEGYVSVQEPNKSGSAMSQSTASAATSDDKIPMQKNKGYSLMAFEGQEEEKISVQRNVGYESMSYDGSSPQPNRDEIPVERNLGYEVMGFEPQGDNIAMEPNYIYGAKKQADDVVTDKPTMGTGEKDIEYDYIFNNKI